jgi:predicted membrane channel-forming protein YqfA (hemolysin III family)
MTGHQLTIALILLLALPLSLSRARDVSLVFVAGTVLILLNSLFPSPNTVGSLWFYLLIGVECLFALAAMSVRSWAGWALTLFCFWNGMGHYLGLVAYQNNLPIYALYDGFIQAGEISQAVALVLFSRPIINSAALIKAKLWGKYDGWHRLEHAG